jgi:Cu(I)/Ag(I) efflux system membrane fusion protein
MNALFKLGIAICLLIVGVVGGIYVGGGKAALRRLEAPLTILDSVASETQAPAMIRTAEGVPMAAPLFYRDPMGKTETSVMPKKDAMGMEYLPVYRRDSEGTGRILFYRDPLDKPEISPTPKKDSMSMDYLPVREQIPGQSPNAQSPNTQSPNAQSSDAIPAQQGSGKGKILYYRNPMGLADISNEPKKDSMGMDYIPVYESAAADDGNVVRVSLDKVQKLGVSYEAAQERKLTRNIRAVGSVQADESRQLAVASRFDGLVEKLYVAKTGDQVQAGQKLLEINSPDLREAERNYVTARRVAPDLMQINIERLVSQGLTLAQIAELKDSAEVPRTTGLYAPGAGVVTEKTVIQGAWVKAGDTLYKLVDLRHVWVLANVYERDIASIHNGETASLTFAAYPGKQFQGEVSLIYPEVEMSTRTAKVRIELDNPDLMLKPGMYADVSIATDLSGQIALTVPDSAILDDGIHQIVLVSRGEGRFEPKEVKLGSRGNGYAEVLSGLDKGDEVVVSANFLIDAESNLQAALRAFTVDKASAKTPSSQPGNEQEVSQ